MKLLILTLLSNIYFVMLSAAFLMYAVLPPDFNNEKLKKRRNRAIGLGILVFFLNFVGGVAAIFVGWLGY